MALPSENIELTTPVAEQKVTLRPYPTARMQHAQSAIFLRYANVNVKQAQEEAKKEGSDGSESVQFGDLPGSALGEINELTVKNFVLTIDGDDFGGDKDKILEACLDMHIRDFQAILDRCNEINSDNEITDAKKAS